MRSDLFGTVLRGAAIITATVALALIGWLVVGQQNANTNVVALNDAVHQTASYAESIRPVVQERVIQLPEDGQAYYTTVILPSNWRSDPRSRNLAANFEANPRLATLKAQTHYNVYTDDQAIYRSKYAHAVAGLPCVMVQSQNGKLAYKVSGANVPNDGNVLADHIAGAIGNYDPSCRPKPKPAPPCPVPDKPVLPDVVPQNEYPMWVFLLAGVAVGMVFFIPIVVIAFINAGRREIREKTGFSL